MYRIKNTANDRTKTHLHRTAPGFNEEPNLGGKRIRMGEFLDIEDAHYERVKPILDQWVAKGMVSVSQLGVAAEVVGPTFEQWVAAGYNPQVYASIPVGEMHSWGWRTKPSAGLTKYLEEQALAQQLAEAAAQQTTPVEPVVEAPPVAEVVQVVEAAPVADTITLTTEPAGAPVEVAPVVPVEERSETKKSAGKKKLY